jgi:hypothetical protein
MVSEAYLFLSGPSLTVRYRCAVAAATRVFLATSTVPNWQPKRLPGGFDES